MIIHYRFHQILKVIVLVVQLAIFYQFNPVYSNYNPKMLSLVNTEMSSCSEKVFKMSRDILIHHDI